MLHGQGKEGGGRIEAPETSNQACNSKDKSRTWLKQNITTLSRALTSLFRPVR